MDKSTAFQANVGAIWGAIDQAEQRLETKLEQEISGLSKLEDADIYKVSSDFKRSETILQSTLMASNKLLQPSLLNFMQ
jgi:flagellar hook-associated protein 3 FlgL